MRKTTFPFDGRRRLVGVIAISAVLALVTASLSTGAISLFPPNPTSRGTQVAAATAHVFVDSGPSSIVHQRPYLVTALIGRGNWLAEILSSDPVMERVAKRAGMPRDRIAASTRQTANVPIALTEPSSEQRAHDLLRSGYRYRIEVQARQTTPIVDIYAQAPTTAEATRLADAGVAGLRDYVRAVGDRQGFSPASSLHLRELGPARGGVVNGGLPFAMALLTFFVTFAVTCAGLLFWLRRRDPEDARQAAVAVPDGTDDWPHTTRLLPWMFAGFLGMLWLLPFNEIQLTVKLPIDLKLDRLLLPFVALTWAIALAVGGKMAPRLRMTWIHVAIGAFLLCSFVSVILNARYLNQTLELDEALKRLPLLLSYVSLFVIASTAIRRTEVAAFMTFTLVVAVICAVGIIWEYRAMHNLFFEFSHKLLPGIFSVGDAKTAAVDDIGRRLVRGPAALPLEAVSMLSMALPIALVSLMQSRTWRRRIWFGIAACLLLAAMFATYRKSALLAPASVIATLAYFRRRELLKLAPLALVLIILVHILAPGAIGGTTNQFDPGRLGVTTVSDRTADYDAIRPDVWTHLLFGRGSGSYDHVTYRILDSEFLLRTIEMGVLGLLAYVLMSASVVLSARVTIGSRDPRSAPYALAGAAAAVSFLVASALFDVLSFPHPTYILLYMAGLVAVIIEPPGRAPAWEAELQEFTADPGPDGAYAGAPAGAALSPR